MSLDSAPRRHFRLPEADEKFLIRVGRRWETIVDAQLRWLIMYGFPLPKGYDYTVADIAVLIQPQYPPGQIDSAYIYPNLKRTDGRPIPNSEGRQSLDGKSWQFWSRHRTPENPWIAGEDDLSSHIIWMQSWLAGEFERATS